MMPRPFFHIALGIGAQNAFVFQLLLAHGGL
jgi:hypothetical protein